MKPTPFTLAAYLLLALLPLDAMANRAGRGGGGRSSGGRASVSSSHRAISRTQASTRPATRPSTRPATRPSYSRPSVSNPVTRPATKPATRPSVPSTRPSTRPSYTRPSVGNPVTLPTTRPSVPNTRPTDPPLGLRPSQPPARPDRPTTLPAKPNRPVAGNRPSTRPDWGNRWNGRDQKFTNVSKNWNSNNTTIVNNFQATRVNQWNSVNKHWHQRGWHRHWGTPAYRTWNRNVWNYRANRCREVWYRTNRYSYYNRYFNPTWWGRCRWHPRPAYVYRCSPWWWWRPVAWTGVGFFFGSTMASQPIVYDPGTTVIYEGDTIYINGESAGNATQYREDTIALANPEVEDTPVPEPPTEQDTDKIAPDEPEGDWLPVGVWALTQQEQGDATMFFQLSVNKDGLVAGAYRNVMTSDEQPIVGKLDFKTQRLAWHVGEATDTVYETGLSNLENDVASVFVHFGKDQTQTWLMIRLSSPEMPPGTVKIPEN